VTVNNEANTVSHMHGRLSLEINQNFLENTNLFNNNEIKIIIDSADILIRMNNGLLGYDSVWFSLSFGVIYRLHD
jgi:hypothetical protein